MVVVCEDHSLGRHVSQRSHRTDRSREKPEPGARRPGARLPWRARERGRPGSARRAGRRGPSARWPAWGGERPRQERAGPRRGRSRAARPRVRPGGSDPGVGRSGGLAEDRARRRRGKAGETRRLCGVRPKAPGWQETEGRREHTLWRLRGRTRGQGRSYTPRRATRGE